MITEYQTENTAERVDRCFPLDKYRPGQRLVIAKVIDAFASGKKYVFVEAPVGSGKSVIGYTIAQMMADSYYLTPQKFLQSQLSDDFGESGRCLKEGNSPLIELKGRNAYKCDFWDEATKDKNYNWDSNEQRSKAFELAGSWVGCDKGECKRKKKSRLPYCENFCKYFIQLSKAISSKTCLMNYHSFLYQTNFTQSFGRRSLLILDECHQTEDVLSKFVEIKLSDRHFQTFDIRFPKYETVKEYINYFNMIELDKRILDRINWCKANDDLKGEEEWKNLLFKYGFLLVANPDEWVCDFEDNNSHRVISIKPIFIDEFANKYIFDFADHILLMSSTILSKEIVGRSLGIDLSQASFFRMGNTFPLENRPILYRPAGSMSYANKSETIPKMIQAVNDICRTHQNERGIIHTHTFEITKLLLEKCDFDVRSRFLVQQNFDGDKQKLLEEHKKRSNSVIVAPAMHEGLDLKDDLGRFQCICKVPYPSKNDPQIAARMELSPEHYSWMTACKIIQSYGRVVRHKEDYGKTYILDGDFKRFCNMTSDLLPGWFKDAIIWNQD